MEPVVINPSFHRRNPHLINNSTMPEEEEVLEIYIILVRKVWKS